MVLFEEKSLLNDDPRYSFTNKMFKILAISAEMSEDDKALYARYDNFIKNCMIIFDNNLDNIHKCLYGISEQHMSAATFRDLLARKNGWNEYLDMSNDFMKDIDRNYNPNTLLYNATRFFTMTKAREDMLANNPAKLELIYELCKQNEGKKTLVVSKNSEFANEITDYLKSKDLNTLNYHDAIKPEIIIGKNGKEKLVKSQALCTSNNLLFNCDASNILSMKSKSSNKLTCLCDVLIFTSPYCDDIIEFKSRFKNVTFNEKKKIYMIYLKGSKEEDKLLHSKKYPLVSMIFHDGNNAQLTMDDEIDIL